MSAAVAQLAAWKASARAGERMVYYTGFLGSDLDLDYEALQHRDAIRAEVVRLYLTGEYELAQNRVGGLSSTFAYFIIKRGSRDTTPRLWKPRTEAEIFRAGQPHKRRAAA